MPPWMTDGWPSRPGLPRDRRNIQSGVSGTGTMSLGEVLNGVSFCPGGVSGGDLKSLSIMEIRCGIVCGVETVRAKKKSSPDFLRTRLKVGIGL